MRRELQRRTLEVGEVIARHLDQAVAPRRGSLRRELQAMTLLQRQVHKSGGERRRKLERALGMLRRELQASCTLRGRRGMLRRELQARSLVRRELQPSSSGRRRQPLRVRAEGCWYARPRRR